MAQTTLELVPGSARPADPAPDGTGFDIGWDHAHHGLVPPAELLLDGAAIGQGWRAGRAVFGRRTLAASRATRHWLALRLKAWSEDVAFEREQVTAHYLAQLQVSRCPVLRSLLGGAPAQDDAAVFDRLNPRAAYAAGNLVLLSQRAATARRGLDLPQMLHRARRAQISGEAQDGLEAAAWWRLAALSSYAQPLPFHEAARMPLAVLPPNRVRLLNAVQGLQALVTLQFTSPGWSGRMRALAALLPDANLRHDFDLFVGALIPRALEAGADAAAMRLALEDAWLQERVQRRWQQFVLALGEAATAALLERATAADLTAVRTVNHPFERATEGWALAEGGRAARVGCAPRKRLRLRLAASHSGARAVC